jgi:hypothetical protein
MNIRAFGFYLTAHVFNRCPVIVFPDPIPQHAILRIVGFGRRHWFIGYMKAVPHGE